MCPRVRSNVLKGGVSAIVICLLVSGGDVFGEKGGTRAPEVGPSRKVIFGEDNRREGNSSDPVYGDPIAGTVALIKSAYFESPDNGVYRLKEDIPTYDEIVQRKYPRNHRMAGLPLCEDQRFKNQDAAANCTGALVSKKYVLTAGHCFRTTRCEDYKFVFGYSADASGAGRRSFGFQDVYGCGAIVASADNGPGDDWAFVRLRRQVGRHLPVGMNPNAHLEKDSPVFMLAHPHGLPLKVTAGGKISEIETRTFASDLDTFGGSSGAPVFDAVSRGIVGVHNTGSSANPFRIRSGENCLEIRPYEAGQTHPARATRITVVLSQISKILAGDARPAPPNGKVPGPKPPRRHLKGH